MTANKYSWKIYTLNVVALIILLCWYCYNAFYSKSMLVGTYIYSHPVALDKGPLPGDTLELFIDGTFRSNRWGKGKFVVNGDRIQGSNKYDENFFEFRWPLYRAYYLGKPRI